MIENLSILHKWSNSRLKRAVGFYLGFAAYRTDGRCTPGTWADLRETKAIQEAIVAGGGHGAVSVGERHANAL